jgi:hypothetical protein
VFEKIQYIPNPLTTIGIFAAISEVSGCAVLPFLNDANQAVYVWFLIVFPGVVILFFFLTLNFNNRVLYPPSQFCGGRNRFRDPFEPAIAEERGKDGKCEN